MKNNSSISEDRLQKVGDEAYTAIEIFELIATLPKPMGEFLFQRIVEDAYAIANVQSQEVIKHQILKALCDSFQSTQSVDPICKYLGINNYNDYKEVDQLILDSKALYEKLRSVCVLEHLPPMEELVRAYSCFSVPIAGDDFKNSWEIIRERILMINHSISDSCFNLYESNNCFIKLSYQTIFEKLACNDPSTHYDILFYKWYCKGELIDSILDTIFKCKVSSVAHTLWELLVNRCEQHFYLSKIVQERYDYYRKFSPGLEKYTFKYSGEKEHESREIIPSLPCIPISNEKRSSVDEETLYKLHELLSARGELDCSFQSFQSVFSGRTHTTTPIRWLKGQKELASFLYVLHAKGKVDRDYADMAAKVFLQKNGKSCSAITLNQPDYDVYVKDYKDLFRELGINR